MRETRRWQHVDRGPSFAVEKSVGRLRINKGQKSWCDA